MKKILTNFLILFTLCICCNISYAKEGIYSIDIDVYIKDNGEANIVEVWNCESYSGTEWYHPYYNLGNAEITNLSVSENGKSYAFLSNWSTSASKSYKKEKCGLNKISDGIEICWGMGDYGKHVYEVSYTIINFVDNLTDSQMVYWTLIPHNRSDKVDNASIKIHADKTFDETVEVWGFGEDGGICRINDGIIEMESKNGLKISEYMTVLAKFPVDFFDSDNNANKNFDDYYNMAIKGTDLEKSQSEMTDFENWWLGFKLTYGNLNWIKNALLCIGIFLLMMVVIALTNISIGLFFSTVGKGFSKIGKIHPILVIIVLVFWYVISKVFGLWGGLVFLFIIGIIADKTIKENKIIKGRLKESQVVYYRDMPCDGDIFKIYYIAYQYGLIKKESDFLGAVILKWIKEGKAEVLDKNKDSKNDSILLSIDYRNWNWDNFYEKRLYQMMFEASGDGVLEKKELKKWCNNKFSELFTWFENIMSDGRGKLLTEEELILEYSTGKSKYKASDKMLEHGKQICGLKKYLKDFTLIHEREPVEVHLFEDYLIIAQILGIAKKVMKQFKDLYPNVIEDSRFDYMDYIFVHTISHRTIRRARYMRTLINVAKAASSSGGGGHSHSGGGGGSRGGGRGGGGRR